MLSVTFLVLVFLFYKNNETYSLAKQRECLFEKQILEIVLKTNIRFEGAKLNDLSLLNKDNQSLYLSSILDTVPSLFLYMPLEGCTKCVEDIYPLITKHMSESTKKVYLLVKSPNFRSFKVTQMENTVNVESFYINEGWLGLDIEHFDTPFLFLADKTLRANSFFYVDKNIPHINEYYIENIFSNL